MAIKRTFLEPAASSVDSYVSTTIDKDQRSLKIADCYHGVTLDFSTGKWDDRTVVQANRKLDKLQAALDDLRASIND